MISILPGRERKMKKRGFFIFLMVTLFWGGITCLALGQEKAKSATPAKAEGALQIVRAVVGTGVENREPVGVAETFPASTEKVYLFLEAANISKDMDVSIYWFQGKNEMSKITLPLKQGAKWRTNAFKNLRGLKGDWKIEVRDGEGGLLKEVNFKVE
jgi:hypothetical protein